MSWPAGGVDGLLVGATVAVMGDSEVLFRRRLSDAEVDELRGLRRGRGFRGAEAAMVRLWDIMLGDALGVSYAELVEADGPKVSVSAFKIPEDQASVILAMLKGRLSQRDRSGVSMAWLNMGPGTYVDDEV